ncbi:PAAR domain-containing protein [Ralstonia solanacearum]|uniref:PAAR domain-containing protein n=1 Tax=Ralstonia solanacearum TaxID=305 RepID=UPI001143C1FC|nr:PAAR domain-containing protein [Ralstonia solanacearum]MBT1538278.1 PAAR domain-containing protein [Ralstonia solanacearum]
MRGVIREGDSTTHGGKVITGASGYRVMGQAVACVGDHCTCPIPGHDHCVIVESDPTFKVNGRMVAFHGHKVSCGATLISSAPNSGRS